MNLAIASCPAPSLSPALHWPPLRPRLAALGRELALPVAATSLPQPRLLHFNAPLAAELGLAGLDAQPGAAELLAGNRPWPGAGAPLASVYGGHQFGRWVRQLGDGRALLVAEIARPDGAPAELQLKGAGPTPWSRGADGRAVLRSSIREYLCSEAMHALGVPTTRALSLVGSPLPVQRDGIERAAVVCRVAPSFVRFGHFEYLHHAGRPALLAPLADHAIDAHFPQFAGQADRHERWLGEVIERTARLVAHWQTLGFCHGVMNTDNFSVLGLTLDYGPFGFMERFRAHHICNQSDHEGRYAWSAQPEIGRWNCARLLDATQSLLAASPGEAAERAQALLARYAPAYAEAVMARWRAKLGLRTPREGDAALLNRLLTLMQQDRCDFTLTFRRLAAVSMHAGGPAALREDFRDRAGFDAWLADWRARLRLENSEDGERAARMRRASPLYVLRNHLAQAAIERANAGDLSELQRLMRVLARPFDERPGLQSYAAPLPAGTAAVEVSCSA